jgi:hypothetical protein
MSININVNRLNYCGSTYANKAEAEKLKKNRIVKVK